MTNNEKLYNQLRKCDKRTQAAFWLCLIAAAHKDPPGLDGLTTDVIEGVCIAAEETDI